MIDVSVIVLAAGSGERFGESKQFLELTPGVRLVDAALEAAFSVTDNVILVLPPERAWDGRPVSSVTTGGDSRLDSVAAGLAALQGGQEVVVIHDSAHPLASRQMFLDVIATIRDGADAAVPLLPVSDVIKRRDEHGHLTTVGRDGFGLAQVPMGFSVASLIPVHSQRAGTGTQAWEDSMLVEQAEGTVVAVRGSPTNIHIVSREDLDLARAVAYCFALGRSE